MHYAIIISILQFKDVCLGLIVCVALCSHSWNSDSEFPGCFADGQVSQAGLMGSSFTHTAASVFTQVMEPNKCLCKSMWWTTNGNTEKRMTFWYNTKSLFPSARSGFTGKLELSLFGNLSGHMDLRMQRLLSIDNLLWFRKKKKLYCVFVTKELVKLRDLPQHKAQVFMSELQFRQGSLKTTFLVNSYAHCVPLIYLIMFCFIYDQNSWSD